jgi:hypothetical protein
MNTRVLSLIHPNSYGIRYDENDDEDTLSTMSCTTMDSSSDSPLEMDKIDFYEEETKEEMRYPQFVPGRFEYVKQSDLKEMLKTAWQAITITENWKFILENDLEKIVWSKNPQTDAILFQIEKLSSYKHSGSSLCHVMKCMKYIAENGEEQFRELFL